MVSDSSRPFGHSRQAPVETPHRQTTRSNVSDDFSRAVALVRFDLQQRIASGRTHFNPNQPRVPAGNPDGGQWTSGGWGGVRGGALVHGGAHSSSAQTGLVMSDAGPYPARVWSQYAQAGSDNGAQDPTIERNRQFLHNILVEVNASVASRRDALSARLYGILVHTAFAKVVRALNLPGIGIAGVEQSFDAEGLVRYGLDGSIRTDIVLRNENYQIIAIFDVKTGNATMTPAREAKIRAFTRVGRDVPVIILRAIRGVGPR